jgi:hypothetical protein
MAKTGIRENTIDTQYNNLVNQFGKMYCDRVFGSVSETAEYLMRTFESITWVFSAQPIPREEEVVKLKTKLTEFVENEFGNEYIRLRDKE